MTEWERLKKLAQENNWPIPKPLDSTYSFFKLWKELEQDKLKNKDPK